MGPIRFPLIADPDAEIAKAYDVWLEKWGTSARATAVIREDGVIVKTYPRAPLDGKGHAEQVYGDCEELFR